ncbi:YacL family protein, partial [Salmonella enterica subsp. enterica serovar Infantis]
AWNEYTLCMYFDDFMILSNNLDFSGVYLEEGMSYYDEESLSLCGLEDFLRVVAAYRDFVSKA